ncbi:hypothetical protein K493DRAFT_316745 [Basidiobolus meristosporus CBS 931.73]|uniref:Uncharacterized protein n=1 Tax=Basidiobolus meristosporus CBS 931.73 TaxID=1314790 RepID=A0A1Y1Y2C4_9FUNG|nr:hypothetical protein K493DRAFT_316745 [Basidiobolus meristosporus CBS 931.73]|eukprot:ORX92153.1 hypothetical protein K493DRAFT_316745 [Basidiobolus meristosporus CBS 931.73]
MKSGRAPEDLVGLLRSIRFGIQEETLEVLVMNYAVDGATPWCIFKLCVMEGSEVTIEVSQEGFTVSHLSVPEGLANEEQVQKHFRSISSIRGRTYPNIDTLLMNASSHYKLCLYPASKHSTESNHDSFSLVCR